MVTRTSLLQALLVAVATGPLAAGCGNDGTQVDTSTKTQTPSGSGGSASGGQAGQGGSTTAGQGGAAAGQGGATTAGQGGSAAGQGGSAAGGQGGSTAGTAGAAGGGAGISGSSGQGGATTAGQGGATTAGQGGATTAGQGGATTAGQGGATTGGQAGAGGSTAGSGGASEVACVDPKPLLVDGKDTGFRTCANGALVRPEVRTCPSLLPRAEACVASDVGSTCTYDSDCTEKPNGHCAPNSPGFGGDAVGCGCSYGCTQDSECGPGAICACGDPVGRCVTSSCTTDADCPEGGCAAVEVQPGCSYTEFACQLLADECVIDADCAKKSPDKPYCTTQGAARVCVSPQCAVGRPLVVETALRQAALVGRSDWGW